MQFYLAFKAWWLWKHETGSSLYVLILFDPVIRIISSTLVLSALLLIFDFVVIDDMNW